MRSLIFIAALLVASPVLAKDVTMTLTDQDQQAIASAPQMMAQCVADVVVNDNVVACRNVARFVAVWASQVKTAADAPTSPPPPGSKANP